MRLDLPDRPHWPGKTARPDESVFAAHRTIIPGDFPQCPAFRAGLACFEQGYFWEAHEFWEPLWAAQPPNSRERQLVRGLIQLANARLKATMGAPRASARLESLARAEFDEAFRDRKTVREVESAWILAILGRSAL